MKGGDVAGLKESPALSAMREGRWREALELWRVRSCAEARLSLADYDAYAHTCARLGLWALHEQVVSEGLEAFPEEAVLQARQLYQRAVQCMAYEQWEDARDILDRLGESLPDSAWPLAVNYYKRNARVMKRLSAIDCRQDRLDVLRAEALFKASEVRPLRLAGILAVIECLEWPDELRRGFAHHVGSVLACLIHYDLPIRQIVEVGLTESVTDMAVFWQANEERLGDLPIGYCEFFARLFLMFGYVDLYVRLRERFVAGLAALPERVGEELKFVYKVALANELGDTGCYVQLKTAAQEMGCQGQWARDYLALSSFYHADEVYAGNLSEQDRDFFDYIAGKSVAVVGPVDVGLKSGKEIDGFDVVVRLSYRKGLGYAPEIFGERTNVSYYIRTALTAGPRPVLVEGMAELDYIVVDSISWRECQWLERLPCRKRERPRLWLHLDNPFLVGYPNAIQRALLDILRFTPRRVKVFSADLYTGMSYHSEYLSYSVRNEGYIFPGFTLHDPISNFLFMQRLILRGVEVDDVLAEVLSLSRQEYIERLKITHVKFCRRADGV